MTYTVKLHMPVLSPFSNNGSHRREKGPTAENGTTLTVVSKHDD